MQSNYDNGKLPYINLSEVCKLFNVPFIWQDYKITKIAHIKRNIEPGCLFFAFATWRIDTYSNIDMAMEKGAIAIVTEKRIPNYPCIVVENSYDAFLKLCQYIRQSMQLELIGVTGSVGKTSTKEMLASILKQSFIIEKNDENSNSSDLAAMNIFDIKKETQIMIQEMAIQNIHESSLAIRPKYAVVTNIGWSHAETFGSSQNILKEKMKIMDGMDANGILILNADDPLLFDYARDKKNVITFAIYNQMADVLATNIRKDDKGYSFSICYKGDTLFATLSCEGKHNILNALAGYTMGKILGMSNGEILMGIADYQPTGFRQNFFERDGIKILADCFNAAPHSVKNALDTLESIKSGGGKKVAILGDMLELGVFSKRLHEEIGEYINHKDIDEVILFGNEVQYIKNKISNTHIKITNVLRKNDLIFLLASKYLCARNVLLFKGSHGMELENVIDKLFSTSFTNMYYSKTYICGRLIREKWDVKRYFFEQNIKTAAIYGVSVEDFEVIKNFLTSFGVEVKYGIDKKAKYLPCGLYSVNIISCDEIEKNVDMIFLSLRNYDEDFVKRLQQKSGAKIIGYKDLLHDIIGDEV